MFSFFRVCACVWPQHAVCIERKNNFCIRANEFSLANNKKNHDNDIRLPSLILRVETRKYFVESMRWNIFVALQNFTKQKLMFHKANEK